MVTPTYKTVDAVSQVAITSGSPEIPLDSGVRASKLTSGATYESVISKLNVEDNVTFDLKIYSFSNDKYISSISKDKFKVSIPLTDELKGKDLVAYYVGSDGKITKYEVEIVDGCAVFYTDHFSIYTIAETTTEAGSKTNGSPKTGDNTNLILLFGLLLVSTSGLMIGKRKNK
ncbi:MAG: LPXTG cell wall anchor domain-containing protein [Lachnospiraceae bacterium]|nr:LPXTG cell wall anchor domain-containing protein [Lachnospiraceae bacterium]MBP3506262.1 LPXTG cell wall anchor domain-containing protein [Lachnospiraceae bacterium]